MNEGFCGWYFRCQAGEKTLALIPAVHTCGGRTTGSLQILTEKGSWNLPFAGEKTALFWREPRAILGKNHFSPRGLVLDAAGPGFAGKGRLRFGPPTPLGYDIMGPFCGVPGMECRHRVFSMGHSVAGRLTLNGEEYCLDGGVGYIEGDRGRSFPREYLWTQCSFPGGALMLSAAEIPLGPVKFTGVIGVVWLEGREYRLASYLGARAQRTGAGEIRVCQGRLTLTAVCLEPLARPLRAPVQGAMTRVIGESLAGRARYRLTQGERVILELESRQAAFEYEF